jgi:hypothetical protein
MATKQEILKEAGLQEPATRIDFVLVRVQKIKYGESEFYNIAGNHAESTRTFSANVSIEQANKFNISKFDDREFHLLKIRQEFRIKDLTGYVKDNIAQKHTIDGWMLSEVIDEVLETSLEYKKFSVQNAIIELAAKLFTARTGKTYSPNKEAEQDNDIYKECLAMAIGAK